MRKNGAKMVSRVFLELGKVRVFSTNQDNRISLQSTGTVEYAQLSTVQSRALSTTRIFKITSVKNLFSTLPTMIIAVTTFYKKSPKKAVI
ncbi:MAG: hypothetical protein R3313_00070 [Candidatus Saccharimonadales bacterium]|nr:hypothetical protein [Candidatus Saccharimonadales bacterium]